MLLPIMCIIIIANVMDTGIIIVHAVAITIHVTAGDIIIATTTSETIVDTATATVTDIEGITKQNNTLARTASKIKCLHNLERNIL